MSKLYFFRHAQASYLAKNYDQLSPKGEQQSAQLGEYLASKNIRFDKIFVGPLVRQQHTYEIVAEAFSKKRLAIPSPIILDELKEHHGPKASRVALPQLLERSPQVRKWHKEVEENPTLRKKNTLLIFQYFMKEWVTGNIRVDEVQSWDAFRQRVQTGVSNILQQTNNGETIGVFTSGGTISAITAEALSMQDQRRVAAMNFAVRNTSFSTFLFSRNQFNLLSFNELPHLEKEMTTFV